MDAEDLTKPVYEHVTLAIVQLGIERSPISGNDERVWMSLEDTEDPNVLRLSKTFDPMLATMMESEDEAHCVIQVLGIQGAQVGYIRCPEMVLDKVLSPENRLGVLKSFLAPHILETWDQLTAEQQTDYLAQAKSALYIPVATVDRQEIEFAAAPAFGRA